MSDDLKTYSVISQVTLLVETRVEAPDPQTAEEDAAADADLDNVLEVLDYTTLSVDEVDE